MSEVVPFNSESFFGSLVGLDDKDALAACERRAVEWRMDLERLNSELAMTPRGDKQGAHVIRQAILRIQSKRQRLRPVIAHYRQCVGRQEAHGMWADAVRSVCGQDKLTEVFAWMKEAKRAANSKTPPTPTTSTSKA